MITSVSLAGYCVDTSKFYDFMFINVCQGCFCFSSDFLSFFSLAYLLQSSSCSICVYICTTLFLNPNMVDYVLKGNHYHGLSLLVQKKISFTSAGDRSNTRVNRCLYIYKALWTKKKEIKIMLSPIFQVTLKKTCACAGSNLLAD